MSFLELAAGMIDKLPQIMEIFYMLGFIVLIWVFGNIAVKSFKKKMNHAIRYGLSFAVGFVIFFCASAMNNVLIFVSGGLADMLRINLFINGIVATIIVSVGLFLVSRNRKEKLPEEIISEMQKRISKMKTLLAEHKIRLIDENDAKRKATKLVEGYSVKDATLREEKWDILMENLEKKKANVFIDPYDGSYEIAKDESFIKTNILGIIGTAVIVGIVIFSLFNFTGFPQSDMSEMLTNLGIPEEDAGMFFEEKNISEDCVSAMSIMARYGMRMDELEIYEGEETKTIIENTTGEKVLMMYIASYEGKDYIMSINLPQGVNPADQQATGSKTNICVSTEDKFCDCLK